MVLKGSCLLFVCTALAALVCASRAQEIDPNYECPELDGQFPHPDCWKWYNCGRGIAWVQECPGEKLYHVENNWCDAPGLVICGDRNPRP